MARQGHLRAMSGWVNRFWFALEYNDLHSLRHMLQHGVNVNHVFKNVGLQRNSQTALFISVSKNSRDAVRELLRHGADLEQCDMWGETPLFVAVRRGKLTMIKFLVDAGANVNHMNAKGETVLFLSIKWGRKDLVDYFISKGICVDTINKSDSTPLVLAFELLATGLSKTSTNTRRRAPSNIQDIIERLIPVSSNLNRQLLFKGSVLWLSLNTETAHSPNNLHFSRLLLQHGARPDKLFFLRFGGLNATTSRPNSEFFTREFFSLAQRAGAVLQKEKTWLMTVLHEMPQELQPYEELFRELLAQSMTPMSLQTLTVIVIRRVLGGRLWSKIDRLPLPSQIIDLLKLK